MAITIDIDTARPYQVHVGTFLLEQAGPLVRATAGGTRAVIVTDTNVGPLYQMPVKQSLEASGYEVSIYTFEAGEVHKRAETYINILEFAAEHELSRSDVIVALGGGVQLFTIQFWLAESGSGKKIRRGVLHLIPFFVGFLAAQTIVGRKINHRDA